MVFHERKEESKSVETASKPRKAVSDKPPEYNASQVQASKLANGLHRHRRSIANSVFIILTGNKQKSGRKDSESRGKYFTVD